MMNWDTSFSTAFTPLNLNYDDAADVTLSIPDPLIDWLPNSCLYTKYVPTWHLIRSYQ